MKKTTLSPREVKAFRKEADDISKEISLCAERLMTTYTHKKHHVVIGNFLLNTGLSIYTQTLGIEETHQILVLMEQSLRKRLESVFGNLNDPILH